VGSSPIVYQSDNKYYILFSDEYSRFSWIYFFPCKYDVASIFAQFKQKVKILLSRKMCVVQCDGGTEYKPLQSQFPEIIFHISCPYIPEHNGLIERKHRHVVKLSLTSMYHLYHWNIGTLSLRVHCLSSTDYPQYLITVSRRLRNSFIMSLNINIFTLLNVSVFLY
jgi:hypothetical protein